MKHYHKTITLSTAGFGDIKDITEEVNGCLQSSGISDGLICIAVPGSTAGITTIEYEAGAVQDLKETLNRLVPMDRHYHHDARWGDGNGFAHIRAALLGATRSFPVIDRQITLGRWQQIVVVDCDNRPRKRYVVIQIIGE